MNSLVILFGGFVCLFIGYLTYGTYLEKQWGVDNSRKTPAHTMADGVDYVPAKAPVLLGHHFSSIAGAGPINGPIQAAFFGWVPCFLWIIIGGIFFGATHDYGALVASIRHKGASIGEVISQNIGVRAKRLFIIFSYLTLLLVVAAFASIVAGTFRTDIADATMRAANGSTAMISLLFIVMAIVFGFCVYRKNLPLSICTVIGVITLVACIWLGLKFPITATISNSTWMWIIGAYILVASVTPVWILLQPRDYLTSFLLYGMLALAVVGVVGAHPTITMPAFVGFEVNGQYLFPILFVTIACGAISGFHSLVSSGTTAKQLSQEKDAKLIGYGGMLIECALAIVSLICIAYIYGKMGNGAFKVPPTKVFASAISDMLGAVGFDSEEARRTTFGLLILAVSAFCLTSLDTATRLARYMFQEFWLNPGETPETVTGFRKVLINKYVSTIITVGLGVGFGMGGWAKIWPLFGAANQLLAGLALLAITSWLKNAARNHRMLVLPLIFMLLVTLSTLALIIFQKVGIIMAGKGDLFAPCLQAGLGSVLFILSLFLVKEALPVLSKKSE